MSDEAGGYKHSDVYMFILMAGIVEAAVQEAGVMFKAGNLWLVLLTIVLAVGAVVLIEFARHLVRRLEVGSQQSTTRSNSDTGQSQR